MGIQPRARNASGGLVSTVDDLLAFARFPLDERDVEDLHRLLGKLRDRSLDSGAPDAEVPDGEELKLEQRARRLLENRRRISPRPIGHFPGKPDVDRNKLHGMLLLSSRGRLAP